MKKVLIVISCFLSLFLVYCKTAKKAQVPPPPPPVTYTADVKPIMEANCTPCHFPPKGNKKPFDTYVRVKDDIDAIISRINRNPTDPGFMPFKHAKLPDSVRKVFDDWKAGGLLE
jgi:hypothetical protein